MQALWWIICGVSVILYMAFTGFIFPKRFFKTAYDIPFPYDRGLKNFAEKKGRSIVYEPRPEYRKYISQYILSERNGKKIIICKLKEDISNLNYDIILFNSRNTAFKTVNVRENIKRAGYTRVVELPVQTAYATLVIRAVDGVRINNSETKKVPKRKLAFFALSSGLLAILEVFIVKLCFANIFGDVFAWGFMTSFGNIFISLGIGLGTAAVNLLAVALYVKLKARRGESDYGL